MTSPASLVLEGVVQVMSDDLSVEIELRQLMPAV
jgi:hypothetical protein